MNTFNTNQKIGEIVAALPKASDVFKTFNIDFCCGGNRALSEAIKEQNLDAAEVLKKLEAAFEETKAATNKVDYREMTQSQLIDHIVNTHHVFMKKALPEISELTTKILSVHGAKHKELFKIHKLFHTLKTELEQHLIKEETILFPMIKAYEKAPSEALLAEIISVTRDTEIEHEGAGDILKELSSITGQYKAPEDGCGSYQLTFKKMQEMQDDLFQHIHLENNILFEKGDFYGKIH